MLIQKLARQFQGYTWAALAVIWCHAMLSEADVVTSPGQCTSLLQVDSRPGRKPSQSHASYSDRFKTVTGAHGTERQVLSKGSHHGLTKAHLPTQTNISLAAARVPPDGSEPSLSILTGAAAKSYATSQVAGAPSKLSTQFIQSVSHLFQRQTGGADGFTIIALVIVLFLSILLGLFLVVHQRQHSTPEKQSSAPSRHDDKPRQSPPASHRSQGAAAPSPKAQAPSPKADRRVLCKELVVPEGTECVLAVPVTTTETSHRSSRSFAVTDKKGKTLLSVNLDLPKGPSGHMIERLTLQSAAGQDTLASCDILIPVNRGAGAPKIRCTILSKDDNLFARLDFEPHQAPTSAVGDGAQIQGGQCYEMVGVGGTWHISFYGTPANHNLNVTNDKGQLLGTVEAVQLPFGEPGSYYQLRVAPLADAGLILMALLALDRMVAANG